MKIVRENIGIHLNEVLRSEDEWANREIAKYQGEPVEEPDENLEDREYTPPNITEEEFEKIKLVNSIHALQEHIWEYGNRQEQGYWQDYLDSIGLSNGVPVSAGEWNEIPEELLNQIFDELYRLVNSLKK